MVVTLTTSHPQINQSELTELLLGRKGGKTTLRIMELLLIRPYNMNQLARKLNLEYKTINYHMDMIQEHKYVIKGEGNYGSLYYASPKLKKSLKELEQIKKYIKI